MLSPTQSILRVPMIVVLTSLAHIGGAAAQCNMALCASHDINLPVNIVNATASPSLTVIGGRVGIGTVTPVSGLDVNLFGADSAIVLPRDSSANRPTGQVGMLRYNTDLNQFEGYDNTGWQELGTGGGSGGSTQWTDIGTGIHYSGGNVGIGFAGTLTEELTVHDSTANPATIRISDSSGKYLFLTSDTAGFDTGSTAARIGLQGSANLALRSQQGVASDVVIQAGTTGKVVFQEAGAERMRITDGKLGIGTSTPESTMDVRGALSVGAPNSFVANSFMTFIAKSNNRPHILLEHVGSNVGGMAVNDTHLFLGSEMGGIIFRTGVDYNGDFTSTGTERLRIAPGGNVGIGTNNPSQKLHIVGNLRVQGSTDCTLGNGSGGTNCTSDRRLKTEVRPISNALEKISKLNGVEFKWNHLSMSEGRSDIGVIAQDVERVFPTAVIHSIDTTYKMVDYASLVAPLIEATKELHSAHKTQTALIEKLVLENAQLKLRIESLEKHSR